MQTISHITYPALAYTLLTHVTSIPYSAHILSTLIVTGIIPDLDVIYQKVILKRPFDHTFQHHLWLSHWPVTYLPLVFLSAITGNPYVYAVTAGLYSHLVLDTFFVADGIMWLFPFSKKMYCFFGKHTKGHHGKEWFSIYKTLPIFKIDLLSFIVLVALIVFF